MNRTAEVLPARVASYNQHAELVRPHLIPTNWTLPERLYNYYLYEPRPVTLSFGLEGIGILGLSQRTPEIIPDTLSISWDILQNRSIRSLSFWQPSSRRKKLPYEYMERNFNSFFFGKGTHAAGDLVYLKDLYSDMELYPPSDQSMGSLRVLSKMTSLDHGTDAFGRYYHYTDYAAFQQILDSNMIRLRSYTNRAARICLTDMLLPPYNIWDHLFLRDEAFANSTKGNYMLGFDIQSDLVLEQPRPDKPHELWSREELVFGYNSFLRYAGPNPFLYVLQQQLIAAQTIN